MVKQRKKNPFLQNEKNQPPTDFKASPQGSLNNKPSYSHLQSPSKLNILIPSKKENFSTTKKNLIEKYELGSLFYLYRFPNAEISKFAEICVSELYERDNSLKLEEAGWLALGDMLKLSNENESILRHIILVMALLSGIPSNRDKMISVLGWGTLGIMLKNHDVENRSTFLVLLGNLALDEQHHNLIVEKFLDAVLVWGKSSSDISLRTNLVTLLANLSLNQNVAEVLFASGALHLVLAWFERQITKKGFVHGCLNTIVNMIIGGKKYSNVILEKGGLTLISPHIKSEDMSLRHTAVIGVAHLAIYEDIHSQLFEEGIVYDIKTILDSCTDSNLLLVATMAINNISKNAKSRMKLISMGIIDSLCNAMERTSDKLIGEEIKAVLRIIDPSAKYQLLSSINSVVQGKSQLSTSDSQEEIPIKNLKRTTTSGSSDGEMSKPGGPFLSLKLVLDQNDYWKSLQESAANKLKILFQHHDQIQKIIDEVDIFPTLITLLSSSQPLIIEKTLNCISFLVIEQEKIQNKYVASGGLYILLKLLSSPEDWLACKAATTIGALCVKNKRIILEVVNSGVIERLVFLLKQPVIPVDQKKDCAAALSVICEGSSKSQNEVYKRGGIEAVMNLLHLNNSVQVKAVAAASLESLIRDNSALRNSVLGNTPVIQTLVKFLEIQSVNVKQCRLVQAACSCLLELSRESNEAKEKILYVEGLPIYLVNILLRSPEETEIHLHLNAIGLLWQLLQLKKGRKIFRQAGAQLAIEELITSCQNPLLLKTAEQTMTLLKKN